MKTSDSKFKHQIVTILLIANVFVFLNSCKENQDELFNKFKNDFSNSIKKAHAKEFNYQYDGLSLQNSYFVDCKLQFLNLKTSGELTDIESFITFKNDAIRKVILRKQIHEGNANGNEAGRNWNETEADSIFIINYKKNNKEIYVNNKLVEIIKLKKSDDKFDYFLKVKNVTENNYKCK